MSFHEKQNLNQILIKNAFYNSIKYLTNKYTFMLIYKIEALMKNVVN